MSDAARTEGSGRSYLEVTATGSLSCPHCLRPQPWIVPGRPEAASWGACWHADCLVSRSVYGSVSRSPDERRLRSSISTTVTFGDRLQLTLKLALDANAGTVHCAPTELMHGSPAVHVSIDRPYKAHLGTVAASTSHVDRLPLTFGRDLLNALGVNNQMTIRFRIEFEDRYALNCHRAS